MTRVFVVDDHQASAEALCEVLEDCGHQAKAFFSPAAALAAVREGPPDVLVTDLRMDGMDGVELLTAVRLLDPGLPVILITAYATIKRAIRATQAGAFAFLTKPLKPEEVLAKVRHALAQRTLATRAQTRGEATNILGRSPALLSALGQAERAARTTLPVLISGESGTGKELFARRIHHCSALSGQPFVAVNCGAIPDGLIESELFGAARGAYTGAHRDRNGIVAEADGGSLFLDEVGELSGPAQVRLLRFLQEGTYRRVGDTRECRATVRIIAATHQQLRGGPLREDLFFRLSVLPIVLPALRERGDDVFLLFGQALQRACAREQRSVPQLTAEALAALGAYDWPGNIRELLNLADRLAVLTEGTVLGRADLPEELQSMEDQCGELPSSPFELSSWLDALEERALRRALVEHDGIKARAAASLGLERNAFRYKLKKHGIEDL